MPIDSNGRWHPPLDSDPGWDKSWEHGDGHELLEDIKDGKLAQFGIADENALINLFDTESYKSLQTIEKVNVLQQYAWFYDYKVNDNKGLNPNWGLDIQKTDTYDYSDDWDASSWLEKNIGWESGGDKIDWAHYNDDELYQAAKNQMTKAYKKDNTQYSNWAGKSFDESFSTYSEIRDAKSLIDSWDDETKKDMIKWAEENVGTLTDKEKQLNKYQTTKHFDPTTNTTYTYSSIKNEGPHDPNNPAANALTIKSWLPPAPPETLKIVQGNAPTPTYVDGVRQANADDIKGWYSQYLNRQPSADELSHHLTEATTGGISFQMKEHHIKMSPEAKGLGYKNFGKTFYNPQAYGTEASITAKLKPEPPDIPKPNITINKITPAVPTKAYMSHGNKVWTDKSVDPRPSKQVGLFKGDS